MKRLGRPPKDPKRAPTKERILEAAAIAFSKDGFASVGLDEIAKRVGLTRPALLYHFGSKESLYSAVLTQRIVALAEALGKAVSQPGDMSSRIHAIVRGFIDFIEAEPDFAPLLLRDLMDGRGPSREILSSTLVPLLDSIEMTVSTDTMGNLPADVALREALLILASSALVYSASPSFRDELWTRGDKTIELAQFLFPIK